jgi:hypothetical protein
VQDDQLQQPTVTALDHLTGVVAAVLPATSAEVLRQASRAAQAEAELFHRRVTALRAAWWNLSPEARWQEDPHRYRAEVLDEACPAYGYLRLPVALGLWGEG